MDKFAITQIIGCVFIFTGILDAWKYTIQANKIKRAKSAKNISRMFLNWAISNDIIKLIYGILIWDFYVSATSLLALFTMFYMWWQVYYWYPYRHRNLRNFKRPSLIIYIINSWLPNSLRRKL